MRKYSIMEPTRDWTPGATIPRISPQCSYVLLEFPGYIGRLAKISVPRPPHVAFPLQGLSAPPCPSKVDLTLEHTKEIYTSEPLGSWSKSIALLPSPAELYIIFEQVKTYLACFLWYNNELIGFQAILCEPMVVLSDEPNTCSEL